MTEVIVTDARTGLQLVHVPFLKVQWTAPLNGLDDVQVTVTLNDPAVAKLNLGVTGAPGKGALAILEFGVFMAAGFIWDQEWDEDSNHLTLTAAGWGSYFYRRVVLPTNANNPDPIILTANLTVPVPGEDEPREKGDSNPATDTVITGFDLGTIGKKLCQLMLAHPGSPEFFRFPADRVGTGEVRIKGAELKNGWRAISDLSDYENGPDIRFETRWNADRSGIEVHYLSGSEQEPRLFSVVGGKPARHRWDKSVPDSSVSGFKVKRSADGMASRAWVSGGRSVNEAIIVSAINSSLLDSGYPLLEVTEGHPTASDAWTLRQHANGIVGVGRLPLEWWTMDVKRDRHPKVSTYRPGDFVEVIQGKGAFIPAGTHQRRIVALSGDERLDGNIQVVTEEVRVG